MQCILLQACGATVGMLCSCSFMAFISTATAFCKPVTLTTTNESVCGAALTWLGQVSFFWYPTIGSVITVVVGRLASVPLPGHEARTSHLVATWCGGTACAAQLDIGTKTRGAETKQEHEAGERQPMLDS